MNIVTSQEVYESYCTTFGKKNHVRYFNQDDIFLDQELDSIFGLQSASGNIAAQLKKQVIRTKGTIWVDRCKEIMTVLDSLDVNVLEMTDLFKQLFISDNGGWKTLETVLSCLLMKHNLENHEQEIFMFTKLAKNEWALAALRISRVNSWDPWKLLNYFYPMKTREKIHFLGYLIRTVN